MSRRPKLKKTSIYFSIVKLWRWLIVIVPFSMAHPSSVCKFTHFHTKRHHLLFQNTHLSDQCDWILSMSVLPYMHTSPISRFGTSFNSLNRWRNSFDWFCLGWQQEARKSYVIENIISLSEQILSSRAINLFECHRSENRIVINFGNNTQWCTLQWIYPAIYPT